jgi:hypothetical protein
MKKVILLLLPFLLIGLAQAVAGNNSTIAVTAPSGHTPYWGACANRAPKIELPPPTGESVKSDQRTILQGGDNIGDAFVVPSLPFEDNGTTAGYIDDYADPCGGTFGGPDVVYSYTPSSDELVNIHLCGTTFYCVLYVFENTPGNVIGCSSFSLVCGPDIPRGALDLLQLYGGNTYYIVVDGYYTSQGPYSIQITQPPHVECPPTSIAEGEADCGDGYFDDYNSGCNDPSLEVFTPISIGDTICGSTGVYTRSDTTFRDTDWYTVTITETQLLTWSAVAECPIQIFMFYSLPCENLASMNFDQAGSGDTASISANCVPGTYYVYISPQAFDPNYPCPIPYLAWLNSSPSQQPPANDDCSAVEPIQIVPDTPVTITGDNTWATMDCVNLGIPETWEAFTLDFPANVTLDFCGTSPAFGSVFIVLEDQCPCGEYIGFNMYTQGTCGDNNFTIRWDSLGPGTYYYPVMSKWGIASGPYTMHITAESWPEINASPDQIDAQVVAGNSTSVPLTIYNAGGAQLDYTVVVGETDPVWLSVDSDNGSIPFSGDPDIVNVALDASLLTPGAYQSELVINSNAVTNPSVTIGVTLNVIAGGCSYVVGDANGNEAFNGLDVTYSVAYFKGGPPPPFECECTPGNTWYVAGDVNGSCSYNGLDVTYMVAYFKGGPLPRPCPDCPPARILGGIDKAVPASTHNNGATGAH